MIRFVDDGEVFNEISEDRNYFLTEAEEILEDIKFQLSKEKRVPSPKRIELWEDGEKVITTIFHFSKKDSLIEQLTATISKENLYKAERSERFHSYIQKEKEYLSNQQCQTFLIRLDQFMGKPEIKPYPLLLSIEKAKLLFDEISETVGTGFYSELEEIMKSIHKAYAVVVELVLQEAKRVSEKDYEGTFQEYLKVRVATWMGKEENFSSFKNYVVARYKSVSKDRVYALYPKFPAYQRLEQELFVERIQTIGFDKAYNIHNQLMEAFIDNYDNILFEGKVLLNDDKIRSLVLSPVVKEISENVVKQVPDERVMESE